MDIHIVSFNLRMDNPGDGNQRFTCRADFIRRKLLDEKPDVIGFQEVLPSMRRWLIDSLDGYTVVGYGRNADYTGESNCVAFRSDRFELFGLHQFWLSSTPYVPGSRYKIQSMCPRICTIVMLCPHGTTTPFRIYNTHLDHESDEARIKGLDSILTHITADNEQFHCPIILTGDFNAEPDSTPIAAVNAYIKFPLIDTTAALDNTFHAFGRKNENAKIDYIFTDRDRTYERVSTWQDRDGELYLSDHYPVSAHIKLGE